MKKHTKIYCDYFGIGEQDVVMCEWCNKAIAVDINHIEPRGLGGKNPSKDVIENLCAMCRYCHWRFEQKKISKKVLKERHLKKLRQ